ncbi:hypothetical protein RR46_02494 [Papilio xuthus]|uniref:Uncharacterized protein n=1 Tax=Papilio xuthus TaxID=66420 RepID=A0A194QH11_PAPXU|nr:hypothetical protein RR46_02494 [Papilio xuthus]
MSAASEPAPAWLTALALALALAALSCAGAQEDLCARLVTRCEFVNVEMFLSPTDGGSSCLLF